MNILLTGATGFIGSCIRQRLKQHSIISVSRKNSDINIDLSKSITNCLPECEMIIHAAGSAHFSSRKSRIIDDKYVGNASLTANLIQSICESNIKPKRIIFLSSVAVYGLIEGENISEDVPLNASDSYGAGKRDAENMIIEFCSKNNITYTILRLPLVYGKNAPGNLNKLRKAINSGICIYPSSKNVKRSIVYVNDVIDILIPASKIGGIYNLTDGVNPNIRDLIFTIKSSSICLIIPIPLFICKMIVAIFKILQLQKYFNQYHIDKLTKSLTFSDEKARKVFNWQPQSVLKVIRNES